MVIFSFSSFSQEKPRDYSWFKWGVDMKYFNADFSTVRDQNSNLLGVCTDNIFIPSLSYYVGKSDKMYVGLTFGGAWKHKSGSNGTYNNINSYFSYTNLGIHFSYNLIPNSSKRLFLICEINNFRSRLKAENKSNSSPDTITYFENSRIHQWLISPMLRFDFCKAEIKNGEISFGINAGYNFALNQPTWRLTSPGKVDVTSQKPYVSLGGFCVGISIHFLTFKKQK